MNQQLSIFVKEAAIKLRSDYTAIIVNYSTGIDSTGALYWAIQNFDRNRIWLVYCDTGLEYDINDMLVYRTAQILDIKPVILRHEKGFLGILEHRGQWPDSKNRWCTSYLKRDITDKWIRANRRTLGERVLFLTGERRDESPRRAKLLNIEIHRTTLKTTKKGIFLAHWYRPVLDYEKGQMFEWGKKLKLDPHPCYEYLGRCSCIACIFMPDRYAAENMKRYPEKFKALIQAEIKHAHTWKKKVSLKELWQTTCEDHPLGLVI